jgi:hypothetical protein
MTRAEKAAREIIAADPTIGRFGRHDTVVAGYQRALEEVLFEVEEHDTEMLDQNEVDVLNALKRRIKAMMHEEVDDTDGRRQAGSARETRTA